MRGALALLAGAAVVTAALPGAAASAGTGGTGVGQDSGARLQGTWLMHGRVTRADGVNGERKGQRVNRTWAFTSGCPSGPCADVSLSRERSLHQIDGLVLHRSAPTRYVAHGQFFVRLRCAGRIYPRGGIAYQTVGLTITHFATVQSTRFATAIKASYTNSRRVNRTPCKGSIGRDAGTYSGALSTPVPVPPSAEFTWSPDPAAGNVSFGDASSPSKGVSLASWSWDFGDPASGSENSSAAANPVHHYPGPGSYSVTLTVTDSNGLTSKITHQVTV